MRGIAETVAVLLLLAWAAGITGFTLVTFAIAFARPPRPPRLLAAIARELVATLALIPAWPLFALLGARYEARLQGAEPPLRRRPVILLHGYLMNRTSWLWLGWVLARRGIGPLFGLSYLTLRGVEGGARRLARFVEDVCAREGAERVDIVAHSMGGLVARRYIEEMGGAQRVRRLVTIATPHRGTAWARLALGHARMDLEPTLAAQRACGLPPDGVLYTSIWSRCDNLVIPPESAQLTFRPPEAGTGTAPGPAGDQLDDVVFDDLGHLSLLVSPRVADVVATRLAA